SNSGRRPAPASPSPDHVHPRGHPGPAMPVASWSCPVRLGVFEAEGRGMVEVRLGGKIRTGESVKMAVTNPVETVKGLLEWARVGRRGGCYAARVVRASGRVTEQIETVIVGGGQADPLRPQGLRIGWEPKEDVNLAFGQEAD